MSTATTLRTQLDQHQTTHRHTPTPDAPLTCAALALAYNGELYETEGPSWWPHPLWDLVVADTRDWTVTVRRWDDTTWDVHAEGRLARVDAGDFAEGLTDLHAVAAFLTAQRIPQAPAIDADEHADRFALAHTAAAHDGI